MKKIYLVLAVAAFAPSVFAQTINSLNVEQRGSGAFKRTGFGDDGVRSIKADLARDGRATIVLNGSNTNTLSGVWRQDRNGIVNLTFNRWNNYDRVSGNGRMTLSNNVIQSLVLDGVASNNMKFSLDFTNKWNSANDDDYRGRGDGRNNDGRNNDDRDNDRQYRGRPERGTINGDGELNLRGRNYDLRSINYELKDNGKATIVVRGNSYTSTLNGTWWQERNNNNYFLKITDGFGSKGTDVRGEIRVNRYNQAEGMTLQGTTSRDNVKLRFGKDPIDTNPDRNGYRDVIIESRGDGNLRLNNRDYDLGRISISLMRNGRFSMSMSGQASEVIQGTWKRVKNGNNYELFVDEGFRSRSLNGDGIIRMDKNDRFESLEISGSTDRDRYKITFRDK